MNKNYFDDRRMDYLDFDYNKEVYHELINIFKTHVGFTCVFIY